MIASSACKQISINQSFCYIFYQVKRESEAKHRIWGKAPNCRFWPSSYSFLYLLQCCILVAFLSKSSFAKLTWYRHDAVYGWNVVVSCQRFRLFIYIRHPETERWVPMKRKLRALVQLKIRRRFAEVAIDSCFEGKQRCWYWFIRLLRLCSNIWFLWWVLFTYVHLKNFKP